MRSKNRAAVSRGSSHLSPRRKSKEPLSRRVNFPVFSFHYMSLEALSADICSGDDVD